MENFKLYYIKDSYIEYISRFDEKVLYNKKKTRPYIGIIINHDGIKYFAPLSSPKLKHKSMKSSKPDIYKIKNGELGILNLNNMIPVPDEAVELVHMDSDIMEERYIKLLIEQINFLNNRKIKVANKAKRLYKLYMSNELYKPIKERCCNYFLLEQMCKDWKK